LFHFESPDEQLDGRKQGEGEPKGLYKRYFFLIIIVGFFGWMDGWDQIISIQQLPKLAIEDDNAGIDPCVEVQVISPVPSSSCTSPPQSTKRRTKVVKLSIPFSPFLLPHTISFFANQFTDDLSLVQRVFLFFLLV
jgi:hypothetical protein